MTTAAKRPLWTCPKCGHRFVTKNLWHSCGRVTAHAQKSRIVFMARVRFGGAVVHNSYLDAGLWLRRRVDHPRLRRVEDYGPLGVVHRFRLERPSDVDAALQDLMREAYRVGTQELTARSTVA